MNNLTFLEKDIIGDKKKVINFKVGDTIKVYTRYKEGDKIRVQQFEGVVLGIKGEGINTNFTVRKVSYGIGVERIFPLYSPAIEKIEIVQRTKVKRAKLYYLRGLSSKMSRLKRMKETETSEQEAQPAPAEENK